MEAIIAIAMIVIDCFDEKVFQNDDELADLVARLRDAGTDSRDVEAKASGRALPKSTRETLSAFSNDGGGTLVLGLAEAAGFDAVGVEDPAKVRDDLASMCADLIEPPVRADIDIVEFEGVQLVVAVVPELPRVQKPSFVKDQGLYTGSYTRSGDGDRHLTQYEVGVLLANRGQPADDAEAVVDAERSDLDDVAVASLLRRVRTRQPIAFGQVSDDVALTRLRVLVRHEGRLVPSLAGVLALGSYPQQFFPQLNVTFVVVPARSKDQVPAGGPRFLDNQTISGSIPVMVAETMRAITRNMSTRVLVSGGGRQDVFDYPLEALREAVVNALMHRDYSAGARGAQVQIEMYQDRLMIRNPGGLFGAVTEEELGEEGVSSSRNGHLAGLLVDTAMPGGDLLVAENRGSGIPAMLATLRRAGMSPPVFSSRIAGFSVQFPKHSLLDADTIRWLQRLGPGLSEAQSMALALMREGRTVTNSSLRQLGLDSREATAALVDLVERGLSRSWNGRRYAKYALAEETMFPDDVDVQVVPEPAADGHHDAGVVVRMSVADRLDQVRGLLSSGSDMSAAQIATAMGDVGERSVLGYLATLIEAGEVAATAPPRSRLRRYRWVGGRA